MPSLSETECWARLAGSDHGVLGTIHPDRGPDLVPVVFAVVEGHVAIPIDRVKPKTRQRLTRLDNLLHDSRASLLVEHYDDTWDELWWVRASGTAHDVEPDQPAVAALADRYPAYRDPGSIVRVIVLEVRSITGWSARATVDPVADEPRN